MQAIQDYEQTLSRKLIQGLQNLEGVDLSIQGDVISFNNEGLISLSEIEKRKKEFKNFLNKEFVGAKDYKVKMNWFIS